MDKDTVEEEGALFLVGIQCPVEEESLVVGRPLVMFD